MRKRTKPSLLVNLLPGFLSLLPGVLVALSSEERLPIHIEADRAEIDEAQGSSIYRGNVTIDQGTLHIKADQIKILTKGSEIVEIIASAGAQSLAHYEQRPDPGRDPVYADAREIIYHVQDETLQLSGQARLQQTTDTFRGELLKYHVRDGTVSLAGSSDPDEEKPGRISISLTPPTSAAARRSEGETGPPGGTPDDKAAAGARQPEQSPGHPDAGSAAVGTQTAPSSPTGP